MNTFIVISLILIFLLGVYIVFFLRAMYKALDARIKNVLENQKVEAANLSSVHQEFKKAKQDIHKISQDVGKIKLAKILKV